MADSKKDKANVEDRLVAVSEGLSTAAQELADLVESLKKSLGEESASYDYGSFSFNTPTESPPPEEK